MSTVWIEGAMSMGGRISIYRDAVGCVAEMDWPGLRGTVCGTGKTLVLCLESLNSALEEDAAEEMRQKGEV